MQLPSAPPGSLLDPSRWLGWFVVLPCPLCHRTAAPLESHSGICARCLEELALPSGGLEGDSPLRWWSVGAYAGALRGRLLRLRQQPHPGALAALARLLPPSLAALQARPLLVPIPGWKRRANRLPGLLTRQLARQRGLPMETLLERSRPVLGQHHLGRALRFANQVEAFTCPPAPVAGGSRRNGLLLVDDILTTGATASSAARTLEQAGWPVLGMVCLARTPARDWRRW